MSTPRACSTRAGALPADLAGLAAETLADLSVLAVDRPDLDGVGYWPVTWVDEDLAGPRLAVETQAAEAMRPVATRAAEIKAAAGAALQARVAAGCAYGGQVAQIDEASQARITAQGARASAA